MPTDVSLPYETAGCLSTVNCVNPISDVEFFTASELNNKVQHLLQTDPSTYDSDSSETDVNIKLADYVLDSAKRTSDGRLILPLLWNPAIKDHLSKNYKLAWSMLMSNLKKLSSTPDGLDQVDQVFREQEDMGIIERIPDVEKYLHEHPNAAFLSHMPVIRSDAKTTKVRMVFLPTQKEKGPVFSNNQCILAGPSLNLRITTAVHLLRFDRFLLTYDIRKAFLNIQLPPEDQDKLLFLWFRNVSKKDFKVIAFKNTRLAFGLKCSPAILMLALYKALVLDAVSDPDDLREFKHQLYTLLYMDNGGITGNSESFIRRAKELCHQALEPYKFFLQQFSVNIQSYQSELDREEPEPTPDVVKLLGVYWQRSTDCLGPKPPSLNSEASTKRELLKTLNGVYDTLGIYLPIMNKAKGFMQEISSAKGLDWDDPIPSEKLTEWKRICSSINKSGEMLIPRSMGRRTDHYVLVCFTDASRLAYGLVMYLVNISTKQVSFLFSSNHFLNSSLRKKTIPSLEMKGVAFGTTKLVETYNELSGPHLVSPIKIDKAFLYNDSMNTLQRIHAALFQFDKLKSPNVFVKNCIKVIQQNCDKLSIVFGFVSGGTNPSDHVTRTMTYKKLHESNFLSGPSWLTVREDDEERFHFKLPHPLADTKESFLNYQLSVSSESESSGNLNDGSGGFVETKHLVVPESKSQGELEAVHPDSSQSEPLNLLVSGTLGTGEESDSSQPWEQIFSEITSRFSNLSNVVSSFGNVLQFINALKHALKTTRPDLLLDSKLLSLNEDFYDLSLKRLLYMEQKLQFGSVFEYFEKKKCPQKEVPPLVNKLNLILSEQDNLLRVKHKFKAKHEDGYPILLAKGGILTELILKKLHIDSGHIGVYTMLNLIRGKYFLECHFSTVKKVIDKCIDCRRSSARTVKLNQSMYRDFRVNPSKIPFRDIFLDHLGPFKVYGDFQSKVKHPVHILLITCLWTRAVHLKICLNNDSPNFLRSLQSHVLQYGLPERCYSDLGSSIVAGSNVIKDYLSDHEAHKYFTENGIKVTSFDQFPKGNSALGGICERLVEMIKLHFNKVLRRKVLPFENFRYLVDEAQFFCNRRPLCFKEFLRNPMNVESVTPITPEMLIKGYSTEPIKIAPSVSNSDAEWQTGDITEIQQASRDLADCRDMLRDVYHGEFLQSLIHQATDRPERYKYTRHRALQVGDVVLLKEPLLKPIAYPMGIVKSIESNELGETTAARVKKGNTGETVYRHSSSLILLIPVDGDTSECSTTNVHLPISTQDTSSSNSSAPVSDSSGSRPVRRAAERCRKLLHDLIRRGDVD